MNQEAPKSSSSGLGQLLLLAVLMAGIFMGAKFLLNKQKLGGATAPDEREGSQLPGLALKPITAPPGVVNTANLKGKVLLINFWGTWCPPCIQEFPHLADLHLALEQEDDFQLIAVSCPNSASASESEVVGKTKAFLKNRELQLPTYSDPNADAQIAAKIDAFPTTLLVDRKGVIQRVWVGYQAGVEKEIRKAILDLLASKD